MLVVKMYRTCEDQTLCDGCSLNLCRTNQTVPMFKLSPGTPCTCDKCHGKFRSK